MATKSNANSRGMHPWWWDSHISRKNSRWLQENLTDMDAKVKAMRKLIEEDADSFARRAEMYYKKRPELMKLVDEFYLAYRALAERYDRATGALSQAQQTITEAFPNQVPMMLADESPVSAFIEAESYTPDRPPPVCAFFSPDELEDGVSPSHFHAVKNGAFTEEFDSVTSRKGLKQLNDLFGQREVRPRVRKSLNFKVADEAQIPSAFASMHISENEVQVLKEALAKLKANDANLLQCQQSLERVSNLEVEVSRAQEDSSGFKEQARNVEAEVHALKDTLTRLESEREAGLLQYQQCLERIQNLENSFSHAEEEARELNERANKAESESQSLKEDLYKQEAEKDAVILRHGEYLETISNLESKLLHAEEEAARIMERADGVEVELKNLKHVLTVSTEEKDAAAVQCQQYLEKISKLEEEIFCAQVEAQRLNGEIDSGIIKLNGAEEQCHLLERSNQSLHSEVESLVLKLGAQGQELTEKQQELGRLWTCIQEDRLRFVEAETVIQTLQHMHSESQEELRSLAAELQNGDQMLKDMVACNQGLQDEIKKIKEENRSLNELNLSSADSVEKMQNEMYQLRETRAQLEEEVGLRIDQRNALQQEIYCLKEEINDLNRKLMTVLEQIDSVGLNPESFCSTVKELQNDNSMLRETCQNERSEKIGLLVELEIIEKVREKNTLLEKSLSALGAELEGFKRKAKALEESHQSLHTDKLTLVAEKGALLSELHIMSQNLDKLSEKNACMENSLSDAQVEHEGLKEKLKSLEDLCHCLEDEKFGAITARDTSTSQFEVTQQRLEDLEERHTQLEERNSVLEKDKESALENIELLSVSLDVEKKERATFTQSTETRLTGLEAQIRILQEESLIKKNSLEEELDNSIKAQLEIFILQKSVQELEEKNLSLLIDCQEFVQMSKLSEKLISELRHENHQQEVELQSLNDQINKLMMGMSQIHKALDIESDYQCADENSVTHVLGKLEDTKSSLCRVQDENQKMHIEYSILKMLLEQLSLEVTTLEKEKSAIYQEFRILTEQSSVLWSDIHKCMHINKELKLELREGDQKVEVLSAKIEYLYQRLSDLQGAYQGLKSENFQLLEDKRSLMKEFSDVIKQKDCLEEENCAILGESFSLSYLSLILMNIISGNSAEQKKLAEDLDKLRGINLGLGETVRILEVKLENLKVENSHLNESLEKSENELNTERSVTGGLSCEIIYGKDLLCQKELKLLEAEQKLTAMQHEKMEWHKIIADLKMEYNEVNVIREDQEKHMLKLALDNYQQNLENECLRGTIRRLDADLYELHKEKEDSKIREENLNSDLSKERTDVKLWEDEAVALFGELQVFAVREALFEEKIHEFNMMCGNFQNQSNFKDVEIELLKDRVNTLESENEGLKSQLASFEPAIAALRVCIASLQDHTLLHAKSDSLEEKSGFQEVEGSCPDPEGFQIPSQDQIAMLLDGFSNLLEMQARIVVTEKAMIKMERLAAQERSRANGKLEAAMREIVELESQIKLHEQSTQTSDHGPRDDVEGNAVMLTKDILPDQLPESPSFGMGMKNKVMAAKQDFETADQNSSIDLKIGEDTGTEHPEKMVEKEVGVDKIEVCSSFRAEAPQESNRGRILERLASDSQRLENLEITVQDLKKKVDSTDKSKVGKDVEYDTVKVQLEEAETAIQKLIDITARLMKITQDNLSSPDGKLWTGAEESGSARKRVLEQARRGSEKIGRLQFEVQKLQFMLLEHDEKDQRAKTETPYRRRLLREYLYGDRKSSRKQKGAHCCACVRPQTKEGD